MTDLAVLTRNFTAHLDPAVDGKKPVTFYSNVAWKRVEDAHISGKSVAVYFVVAENPRHVAYTGILKNIVIPPVKDSTLLDGLLSMAPDAAAKEAVSNGKARTVYSVTNVQRLPTPFSQTELLKLSDGSPVNANYERSYCIVSPFE